MDPTNQASKTVQYTLQEEDTKKKKVSPPVSPLIEVTWEKSFDGLMSPVFTRRVMPSSDAIQ